MVVGVTHVNGDGKIYYFNVPKSIQSKMQYGKKVLCNTRFGEQICRVKEILNNDTVKKLEIKPTKNIIACQNSCMLEAINVPDYMKKSLPSAGKIIEKLNDFYSNSDGIILVDTNGELVDGYITYQIQRMFYKEYITVYILTKEFESCSL